MLKPVLETDVHCMKAVYVAGFGGWKGWWGAGAQHPAAGWCLSAWLPVRWLLLPDLVTGVSHPQRTVSTSIHSSQTCKCSLPLLPWVCEVREIYVIASQNAAEGVRDSEEPSFMRKRGCIRQLGQAADARPQPKGLAPRHCLLPTLVSSERGIRSGKERACN